MAKLVCSSCGENVLAKPYYSSFPCPACGKETIVRCSKCKSNSVPYVCKVCKFEGP